MRRLPVYFVIDVSESMVGEPIQRVEEGIAMIVKELKSNPTALETVWLSVVIFAGQAKTIIPLQDIVQFYPPKLPIGSGTSLANGLGHLMYELRTNVRQTTMEVKGDWKPIIFLFTDGAPTDPPYAAIAEWNKSWKRASNLVAVSFGDGADLALLGELTENVLVFDNATPAAYKEFFRWVTDSIKTSSEKIETGGSGFDLSRIDGDSVSRVDLSKTTKAANTLFDQNYAILAAKCQSNQRPYLIKYKKGYSPAMYEGFSNNQFHLIGAYAVDQQYFELSGENAMKKAINTEELHGAPTCPCCGNQFGFAMCQCGNIHCIGPSLQSVCPWCGNHGQYGHGGAGGFDVSRTQG
jgi:uncharacterized protein YegL